MATVTSKGQITLPKEVRRALGAEAGEDKLVVALAGQHSTTEQITELITFQEQFFDSRIVIDEGPKISNL